MTDAVRANIFKLNLNNINLGVNELKLLIKTKTLPSKAES